MSGSVTHSIKSPYGHLFVGTVLLYLLYMLYHLTSTHPDTIHTHIAGLTPSFSRLRPQTLPPFSPDDLGPLAERCQEVVWEPRRVWECDYLSGGTSNVYNEALNCIRFAIEAGATSLVLPAVWKRSASEPVRIITGNQSDITDLSYLFDVPHLKKSLRSACPSLQVYDALSQVAGLPARPRSTLLHPKDLGADLHGADSFRANLDAHLARLEEDAGGSYRHPSFDYIVMSKTYFTWPVTSDGPRLANTMQSLLHFRADIRAIAAAVLALLHTAHGATTPYYGAHLRTGPDLDPDWARTGFTAQYESYTGAAVAANLSVMYIGGGVGEDTARFAVRAWAEHGLVAVTKEALLGARSSAAAAARRALDALASDQAALVDFELLARAARFGGMHRSSFAWQLALRRHTASSRAIPDCLHDRPDMFEDEFSHILNAEADKWFDLFVWGTWP